MKHRIARTVLALLCTAALSLSASAALFSGGEAEPPSVAAFSKNGPSTGVISFSQEDFRVSGDAQLTSIVLTGLPDPNAGVLTVGDQPVPVGSEVSVSALDGLRFNPLATPMLSATSFTFSPVFEGGETGDAVTVGLYLLSAPNEPPVAQDVSLCTYKNVEVQGSFSAVDPEGDLLTYQLVSKPARGSVTLSEDGSGAFTYTPYENKTGKDAFTYAAVDDKGNTSSPATVTVKIEKQKTKVTYSDMAGVEGHREAVRLAEDGLLVGEKMGDRYLFHPEGAVSRAQFTALALAAAGVEPMADATLTGFADDDAMDAWAKPYVSAALRAGVVQGACGPDGQVVFQAGAPITAAEAAVVLDRALNVSDVSDTFADAAPAWASQSVSNLNSCGALPASAALSEPLTRSQAALMLSAALDVVEARDAGGWLPW